MQNTTDDLTPRAEEAIVEPQFASIPARDIETLPFDWKDVLVVALLLLAMAAGYWLRSTGRNWDDFTHLHPDERFMTDVASKTGSSNPVFSAGMEEQQRRCSERYDFDETAGYFDAECSNLNPNNIGFGLWVYGEFPLFTTRLTAELIAGIENDIAKSDCLSAAETPEARDACNFQISTSTRTGYNGIHFVGRMVSSVADTLTILIIFLMGLKLFGRWHGLLASILYAFAAFPIQQSHFWTVDAFTSLWVALTLYMAINVLDDDASRRSSFSPLAWITLAVGAWVFDQTYLDAPSVVPLIFYGADDGGRHFLVVGI